MELWFILVYPNFKVSTPLIYQKFDSSNTLIQATEKDGTIINYTYTRDASGKIVKDEGKKEVLVKLLTKLDSLKKTEWTKADQRTDMMISDYNDKICYNYGISDAKSEIAELLTQI